MKKIIRLLLALIMMGSLVGCDNKNNEESTQITNSPVSTETSNQETVKPEPQVNETSAPTPSVEVNETPTPTPNFETNQSSFKTVNVKGLFDIKVIDPLPAQMEVTISAVDNLTEGSISFDILSSNPNCSPKQECMWTPYSFDWYTSEALKIARQQINIDDENYITEYETSIGTVYIYRSYIANLNYRIADESYPDYVNDDFTLDYQIEDLIQW